MTFWYTVLQKTPFIVRHRPHWNFILADDQLGHKLALARPDKVRNGEAFARLIELITGAIRLLHPVHFVPVGDCCWPVDGLGHESDRSLHVPKPRYVWWRGPIGLESAKARV